MTLSVSTQVSPVGTNLIKETNAGATANNDVTGTSGAVYMIEVDNSANSAASFLKIYDDAAPTIGTAVPDYVFRVPANQVRQFVSPGGMDFANLSFAVVTVGGTTGTTDPANTVIVAMVTS